MGSFTNRLIAAQLQKNRMFFTGIPVVRDKDTGDRGMNAAAMERCGKLLADGKNPRRKATLRARQGTSPGVGPRRSPRGTCCRTHSDRPAGKSRRGRRTSFPGPRHGRFYGVPERRRTCGSDNQPNLDAPFLFGARCDHRKRRAAIPRGSHGVRNADPCGHVRAQLHVGVEE